MMKNPNKWLVFGILLIIAGIFLFIYSVLSYSEVKALYNKVNFDELDNNNQIPTNEKYNKYLQISDFLNKSLDKNKNLPYKKVSCMYLDYAQHDAISLYKLIYNGDRNDVSRRAVVEKRIKNLSSMIENYKICPHSAEYKMELETIIQDIKKSNELHYNSVSNIDSLLPSENIKPQNDDISEPSNSLNNGTDEIKGDIILEDSYSGDKEIEQNVPVINN